MKKIYSKFLIITALTLVFNLNSKAQDWMVGDIVNDTIKYLTVFPLGINDTTSCYDTGVPDMYFAFHTCPDPGIDYGYVVEELTSTDTVEITPSGVMNVGDTVWCTEEPLWVIIERKMYFHEADGYIKLRFFAIGEVTLPDVEIHCQPADDMWMQQLAVCNNLWWYGFGCTTISNPLSINDISIDDVQIAYPSRLNGYDLSVNLTNISKLEIFDIQGRKVAESILSNSIDCNELNSGTYVVSMSLSDGAILRQKFILTK